MHLMIGEYAHVQASNGRSRLSYYPLFPRKNPLLFHLSFSHTLTLLSARVPRIPGMNALQYLLQLDPIAVARLATIFSVVVTCKNKTMVGGIEPSFKTTNATTDSEEARHGQNHLAECPIVILTSQMSLPSKNR